MRWSACSTRPASPLSSKFVVNNKQHPENSLNRVFHSCVGIAFFDWLGCRDSNPNYLIQSQASYR